MGKAARVMDPTTHVAPLGPGPGSPDVNVGFFKAWRAVPAGPLAAAIESASDAVGKLLAEPTLSPTSAASKLGDVVAGLNSMGAAPAAQTAVTSAVVTLLSTNAGLAVAWASASAAPGGQPAADMAYTMGLQSAAAAAASQSFASLVGMADLHNCPMPAGAAGLHGPGVVTRASKTVYINGLPAVRQDDKVIEACGGSDPILIGCSSVNIGD